MATATSDPFRLQIKAAAITLTLTSDVGGTDLPWTFGQVFARGEFPPGRYPTIDEQSAQIIPKAYWTDGSLRHAIISARSSLQARISRPFVIRSASSQQSPGGSPVPESVLSSIASSTAIEFGSFGTVTLASCIGSPHKTWIAGPIMSSWVYRKQIGSDPTLVAWFEVRAYQGGAIEILPWLENGYVNVDPCLNKTARAIFRLAGNVVYDSVSPITCYNHSRLCLMQGKFSHWHGTDPRIRPKHDGAYLRSTKMVPNYAWDAPSEAALQNDLGYDGGGTPWILTYTPNAFANTRSEEPAPGFHSSIALMSSWDVMYVTSGDPRMWDTMLANHFSHSIMPVHHRDENTQEPAILTSAHQNKTLGATDAPGGTADVFHHPNQGYLPYLLTGRHFFLDSLKFRAGWAAMTVSPIYRGPPPGIFCYLARGLAWTLRSCAVMLAALPDADAAARNWLSAMFETSANHYINTNLAPRAVHRHPLGLMPNIGQIDPAFCYTCGYRAFWFDMYIAASLGLASDLDLPLTTAGKTALHQWRDYVYEGVLGAFGATGGPTGMCWSRGPYTHHMFDGPDTSATYDLNLKPETHGFTTWDQVFQYTYGTPQASATCPLDIHSNDDPSPAPQQQFVNYYPAYMTPVLAMARDHGVHPDYWTRWAAGPNWPGNINNGRWLRDRPLWAISPRK